MPNRVIKRAKRALALTSLALIIGAVLLAAGYGVWYFFRPQPPAIYGQTLFEGITYTRIVNREPRPHIVHLVEIDLTAPGLGFLVTPGDNAGGFDYIARTTSEFLTEFGVQLAINGDFFDTRRAFDDDTSPQEIELTAGTGVNARGFAASRGQIVTQGYTNSSRSATLYLSADNRASINVPIGAVYNAISGHILVSEGRYIQAWRDGANMLAPQPRTAVGINARGDRLFLVVVDGRQPNYSDGVTMEELADILIAVGAYNAINLDGGGSATLVIADANNQPVVLNSPIHSRIPGNQRPSANHLGVFAQPITEVADAP